MTDLPSLDDILGDQSSDNAGDDNQTAETSVPEATAAPKNTMNNAKTDKPLTPQQQARLTSLKSMLNASNQRYQQATKNRRPIFAAGLEVKVTSGDHVGENGVVLDADYIENRALVSIQGHEAPVWITFKALGNLD